MASTTLASTAVGTMELLNGSASRLGGTNGTTASLDWNGTSAAMTPTDPCDFQNALEDALFNVRSLLKAAQSHVMTMPNGHHANALSKVEEISAIAGEIKECLLHNAKLSDCNENNSSGLVARKKFDPLQPSAHDSESWASSTTKTVAPANSSQPSIWSGFYNKTLRERFDVLSLMYPRIGRTKQSDTHEAPIESVDPVAKLGELPLRTANLMIENCIGVIGIPLG